MTNRLVLADQSAGLIITALQQATTRDRILDYFGPVCNCDVVDWVKTQIYQQNQAVISKIRALIAPDVAVPPSPVTQPAWQGYASKFEDKGAPLGEVYTYYNSTGASLATSTVNVYTPAGQTVRQYCNGTTLMEERSNGTGGITAVVIQLNSPTCT